MTALRWFLSYLLPMVIITIISTAYLYREKIVLDWYNTLSWPVAQINEVMQQQKQKLDPNEITKQHSKEKIVVTELKHDSEISDEKITNTDNSEINNNVSTATILSNMKLITDIQKSEPSEPSEINTQIETTNTKPTTSRKKLTTKQHELLYLARSAFWSKDFITSKKYYLELLTQLPNNPDIQGELGNLFYANRKLESAINHYYLAAKLLVSQQRYWTLGKIMPLITRFNPTKAAEIMRLLYQPIKIKQ